MVHLLVMMPFVVLLGNNFNSLCLFFVRDQNLFRSVRANTAYNTDDKMPFEIGNILLQNEQKYERTKCSDLLYELKQYFKIKQLQLEQDR